MPALTAKDESIIRQIAAAKAEEVTKINEVRIENQRRLDEARVEARRKTNNLVARAVHVQGLSKTVVNRLGLGAGEDRNQVYARLREADPIAAPVAGEEATEILNTEGLVVVFVEDGWRVELTNFGHPDLGDELITGEFNFDRDGELLSSTEDLGDKPTDAMFALKLWTLPEVQAYV